MPFKSTSLLAGGDRLYIRRVSRPRTFVVSIVNILDLYV